MTNTQARKWFPHNTPLSEQSSLLPREQQHIIEQLVVLKQQRDHVDDNWGRMIDKAITSGVSYGLTAYRCGVAKEVIWRAHQRWKERPGLSRRDRQSSD